MIALSLALAFTSTLAWDAWRRYLAARDKLDQVRVLEAGISARLKAIDAKLAEQQRAIGIRAIHQARMSAES